MIEKLERRIAVSNQRELADARRELIATVCAVLGLQRSDVRFPQDGIVMWTGSIRLTSSLDHQKARVGAGGELTVGLSSEVIDSVSSLLVRKGTER